jgi:hypothetical protein
MRVKKIEYLINSKKDKMSFLLPLLLLRSQVEYYWYLKKLKLIFL